VALDMLGFDMVRDVAPGEAVFIDEQGRFLRSAMRGDGAPHTVHF